MSGFGMMDDFDYESFMPDEVDIEMKEYVLGDVSSDNNDNNTANDNEDLVDIEDIDIVPKDTEFVIDCSCHYVYEHGQIKKIKGFNVQNCFYRYKNEYDYGIYYYVYDFEGYYDHETYQVRIDRGKDLSLFLYGRDEKMVVLIKSDIAGVVSKSIMDMTVIRLMKKYPEDYSIFCNMGFEQLTNDQVVDKFDLAVLDAPLYCEFEENGYDEIYQVPVSMKENGYFPSDVIGDLVGDSANVVVRAGDCWETPNIVTGISQKKLNFIRDCYPKEFHGNSLFLVYLKLLSGEIVDQYEDWAHDKNKRISSGVIYFGSTVKYDFFCSYFSRKKKKFKFVNSHFSMLCGMFASKNHFLIFYKIPHNDEPRIVVTDMFGRKESFDLIYVKYGEKIMNSYLLRLFSVLDNSFRNINYSGLTFNRYYFNRGKSWFVDKWGLSCQGLNMNMLRVYGLLIDHCDLINSRNLSLSRSK